MKRLETYLYKKKNVIRSRNKSQSKIEKIKITFLRVDCFTVCFIYVVLLDIFLIIKYYYILHIMCEYVYVSLHYRIIFLIELVKLIPIHTLFHIKKDYKQVQDQ